MVASLDDTIGEACTRFIEYHGLSSEQIADGYRAVRNLGGGSEPDYEAPAVVVGYAFQYLAKRTAAIVGALTRLGEVGTPHRIVDVGSGSGATSLALSLLLPRTPLYVVAIEPSVEMRRFAQFLSLAPRLTLSQRPGTWEDLVEGRVPIKNLSHDLVVMSACLPYQAATWSESTWNKLGKRVSELTMPPAAVIAIQPGAKSGLLSASARALDATGYYDLERLCCHDLPQTIRTPRTLTGLTAMLREAVPNSYPVDSWNPTRNDSIAIGLEFGVGDIED